MYKISSELVRFCGRDDKNRFGVFFLAHSVFTGCFVYADDIIVRSATISGL